MNSVSGIFGGSGRFLRFSLIDDVGGSWDVFVKDGFFSNLTSPDLPYIEPPNLPLP